MSFPQDLVDEILNNLPLDDMEDELSLQNCSLVAKSWTNPSQKRLFETVVITKANRQLWLKNISPTNIELLRHVRSLSITSFDTPTWQVPFLEYIDIDDLYDYFPSFHQLHTIELRGLHISSDIPQRMEMFSSCQQSLSSLFFVGSSLRWHSFIALIDYFPNLRHLELQGLSFENINSDPPPLSRPLRGKLGLHIFEAFNLIDFSNWFTGLEVEYEELAVNVGHTTGIYSQTIVTACEKTLKYLKIGFRECIVPLTMLQTSANQTLKWTTL